MAFESPLPFVPLSTQTVSNVSEVTFTSKISSNFSVYRLVITDYVPRTDNTGLTMTFSTDNGATYLNSNYKWLFFFHSAGGVNSGTVVSDSDSSITLQVVLSSTTSNSCSLDMSLYNLNSSVFSPLAVGTLTMYASSSDMNSSNFVGCNTTTTPINAIKLASSSGNLDGTFTLFGSTDG